MSTQLIESEVSRFLSSSEPEVICLTGHWGVGKTFAWRKYVQQAQRKNQIALKRYSYVSLFGINSLDALKYLMFENTVGSLDIGIDPSLETLRSNALAVAERLGRKSVWFLQQIPRVTSYVGSLAPAWFLSVRNTIICIDDIERRGSNLTIREVLGLASMLKEQRGCKIALILNSDALDGDKEEFRRYYEKVVDISLNFAPTSAECAAIALDSNTKTTKWLADDCVQLGISNIRLMKRIERSARAVQELLQGLDELVLKQAIHSLTLFGWSLYEPNVAPSIDYLVKKRGREPYSEKNETVPADEAAWNALLDAYEFAATDALDLALLEGIKVGYFDPKAIKEFARQLNNQIVASKLGGSFSAAWDSYHDSFDDNANQVLDAMYKAFMDGAKQITPLNMSSTVSLFKTLGRPEQASEMVAHYLAVRSDEPSLFDPRHYLLFGPLRDSDVTKAFEAKHASFEHHRDPSTILSSIAANNGWSPEDIAALANLPVDEYYKLFKETKGQELRKVINACLQFDRISNASPEIKEVAKRAKEALTRIGLESPINAHRVIAYGVNLSSTPDDEQAKA